LLEAFADGMSSGIIGHMTMVGGIPFFVGPTSLADAELTTGERFAARVLKMLASGDVLLAFGQNRAVVSTSDPLQPGDRVELEVVTGGLKPELRIVTDGTAPGSQPAVGQRLTARVVEMLPSGDALVELDQSRAVVRTVNPLQPGDRVMLEVVAGGSKPEFKLVTDNTAAPGPPSAAAQVVAARVLEMLPPETLLPELGPQRAVPRADNMLQPGDRVVLEVVTGGPTPELRVLTDNAAAGPQAAAQQVAARVVETLPDGDVLVELGQSRTLVPTSQPLQPGDRVVLEVVVGGATPEFRVAADETTGNPQAVAAPTPDIIDTDGRAATLSARDLPVILRALADVLPSGVSIADAGQEFLHAATASGLHPAVTAQIQRLLAPLEASLPPAALAVMIRTFIAQSGLFTENQLGEAVKSGTGTLTAEQRHAVADVRVLLGELATAGTPVPEAVRSYADALLQQQLAVAERQAATGVAYVAIPFMFGEERVDVAFEWDRQARREKRPDGPERTISLGVFVHLKALGAIEARVEWQPESVAVTFFVEREATRSIIEAALDDFSKQLSLSGCPAVTSHVRFSPDRPSDAPPAAAASIPGGSIFDVRA
jgi:hypothetical protein